MFDSLDEQMKHDKEAASTRKERILQYALMAVTSILIFGGVYMGIKLLG